MNGGRSAIPMVACSNAAPYIRGRRLSYELSIFGEIATLVVGSIPFKATELVLSTSETEVPVSNEVSKAGEFRCGRLGPQAIDEVESAALTMEKLATASLKRSRQTGVVETSCEGARRKARRPGVRAPFAASSTCS